jgi:hypothetical protein
MGLGVFVLNSLLLNACLHAAFKDPGFLARPAGMGGAFTGVADDINSAWINPAGLTNLSVPAALFTYSKPFSGLDGVDLNSSYAAYAQPFGKYGTAAASWARFATPGLYEEDSFLLSYGYNFKIFSAGASLKYLGHSVVTDERTADDTVFSNGTRKGAFSADLGLLKAWTPTFSTGLCVKNLNQPDVGFGSTDNVPAEFSAGASKYFTPKGFPAEILIAADVSYRDSVYNIHAGTEFWFLDRTVAARAGGNYNEASLGGSYYYNIPSTNLILETDYSFTLPFSVEGTSGSHRLSLGILF